MISLNQTQTERNNAPARAVDNAIFFESSNANLWKLALEKSGLYIAINKFEIIKDTQSPKEALNQLILKNTDRPKDDTSEEWDITKNTSNAEVENLQENSIKNDSLLNLKWGNRFQATVLNQSFFNQSFLIELVGISKNTQIRSVLRDLTNEIQWLNKNAVVTASNSNLEVWIRDSSLTGNKLSDVLKNIRHSMSELGASLSKVTINGKIAFFREK